MLGTATGTSGIAVTYFVGGIDRTAAIVAGTYTSGTRAPGAFLKVEVRVAFPAGGPASSTVVVTAASASKPTKVDVVQAITSR